MVQKTLLANPQSERLPESFLRVPTLVPSTLGVDDDFHLSNHPLGIIEEAHNWLRSFPLGKIEGGLEIRRSTRAISSCP